MRANSAAIAVVAVLAFLPCSDAAAQEQWVPWAAAGWSQQGVDLAGIVENWPALEGLRGACSISMGIRPKRAGGAARELWLHVPETAFGDLPLGVLDVAVTEPLRTGPSVVRMQMRGPVAGLARAHFELPARVDLLGGKVDWRSGPVEGQVVLRDVDLDAVTAAFPVLAIGGKVDLTLDVGGSTKNLALSGRIQGDDLSWRSDAIGRVVGTVNHRDNLSKIAVEWGPKARSIANLTASVPLDISLRRGDVRWLDAKPHDMTLSARGLTPKRLRPFWRAPHGADFSVDVFAGGLGTLDDFGINVTVTGRLIDPDRPWIPVFATAHLGPRRQTAQLTLGEELLEIGVETEANLIGIRRRGKRFETAELRGSAALRLPLARVSPYLSEAVHDLSGKLIGDVAVEGTLGQPKFTGAFSTSDGGVTLVDLNLRLNQLKFAGRLEGTTLQISDLSGLAGLGRIGGSGQLELIATPPGKPPAEGLWSQWSMKGAFDGGLERFPFIHDSFPNGLVDTKFRAELEAGPGETNLELVVDGGSLFVSEAHILPEAAAIPENRGVRLIDWRGDVDASRSFLEGDGHLRARVWLAAPFKVRGETTELDFTGGVVVDRVDRDVAVEGAFEARKGGEFHLFDNEFTVLGGTLTVAGGNLDEREALAQGASAIGGPQRGHRSSSTGACHRFRRPRLRRGHLRAAAGQRTASTSGAHPGVQPSSPRVPDPDAAHHRQGGRRGREERQCAQAGGQAGFQVPQPVAVAAALRSHWAGQARRWFWKVRRAADSHGGQAGEPTIVCGDRLPPRRASGREREGGANQLPAQPKLDGGHGIWGRWHRQFRLVLEHALGRSAEAKTASRLGRDRGALRCYQRCPVWEGDAIWTIQQGRTATRGATNARWCCAM